MRAQEAKEREKAAKNVAYQAKKAKQKLEAEQKKAAAPSSAKISKKAQAEEAKVISYDCLQSQSQSECQSQSQLQSNRWYPLCWGYSGQHFNCPKSYDSEATVRLILPRTQILLFKPCLSIKETKSSIWSGYLHVYRPNSWHSRNQYMYGNVCTVCQRKMNWYLMTRTIACIIWLKTDGNECW